MINTNTNQNLQVPSPCLDEPPPPPVPPPPPPPRKKPINCVQCSAILKDSPARRSGPQGPGTLCNACGLRIIKRKRVARGAIKKSPRRARTNKSTRKRNTQSQNNASQQPPPYPNHQHASASTDASVQPRLFAAINPAQSHTAPASDPPLPVATSIPANLPQSPEHVDTIQPNPVQPARNPAHTPAPVQHQNVAPSVRQTCSSADPLHLQLSADASLNAPLNNHQLLTHPPHHPIPALQDQYAVPDGASAEQMLGALQIGPPIDTGAHASDNTIDQASFADSVFNRCDSAETTSTQLSLVDVLEGMEVSSERMPPGNPMLPVEGPYHDNGAVDPIAMAMGSMAMATPPVSMAPFTGMMPVQSSTPMPTVVMQPSDITTCMGSLTTLDQMNSHIAHSVSNMDERIAALTRKHEELTQARNQVSLSITQLVTEKNVAAKKQRQVCDDIARTTCLLHYLQKQEPFPTGA